MFEKFAPQSLRGCAVPTVLAGGLLSVAVSAHPKTLTQVTLPLYLPHYTVSVLTWDLWVADG